MKHLNLTLNKEPPAQRSNIMSTFQLYDFGGPRTSSRPLGVKWVTPGEMTCGLKVLGTGGVALLWP